MKKYIVLIILLNVSLICSAQSKRNEVIEKISIVYEIIENSS